MMSGRFFLMPPVNRPNEQGGGFVVYSDAWQELQPAVLYLERQYRQNDEQLLEILTALRTGDVRRRHVEALLARTEIEPPDGDITELHNRNVDLMILIFKNWRNCLVKSVRTSKRRRARKFM